jgi:hypothetical protein
VDIKQKIQDVKLLAKNDRRVMAGGIAIVLILLFVWVSSGEKKRRARKGGGEVDTAASSMTDREQSYRDLVRSLQSDISMGAAAQRDTQEKLERVSRDFSSHQEQTRGVFEIMGQRLEEVVESVRRLEEVQGTQQIRTPTDDGSGEVVGASVAEESAGIEYFGDKNATVPPPPPPPPAPLGKTKVISPGDAAPVLLLTGVNAPVDGTPYPVVFKLQGPITGPDGSSLDLGEGRIVAAAIGSETDGRVVYRLTDLSFRNPDGRRSIVKVDGWVLGEDGIRGMKGKLIDKLGQLIASTAGYSFVAALGERLDDKSNQLDIEDSESVTIDSGDLDVATASALTDASNRLGQLLVDKYEKLVPVVEVKAGRDGAAVFAKPAEVAVFDESGDEGIYAASLD